MTRALACATLLLLAGCGGDSSSGDEQAAPARVPVGLGTIVRDSIVETLPLTGRLQPRPGGSATLAAPAAGIVRTVRARVGDRLARGALAIELEVPELVADATREAAAAGQAEREAARQQQLLADGITSVRQADEAAAAARQATAAAAAARHLLARTRVVSPIAGQVQEVLVQSGERVEAGRALVQVVATDTLDLLVPVPASLLSRLHTGQLVEVRQDADTTWVPARLAALAPDVDSLTNAGEAVIRVGNPGGRLHPGATAAARIRLGVRRDVLVAPDSALVLVGDSSVVFVVGPDSVAHQRAVVRGPTDGGRTEVRGELRPGERVVTTGAFGLQDGMHVMSGR